VNTLAAVHLPSLTLYKVCTRLQVPYTHITTICCQVDATAALLFLIV
jgi:hypothetical protein